MAIKFNMASVGGFLAGMKKMSKSKSEKLTIGDTTYWITSITELDKAAREPDVNILFTGLVSDSEGVQWMTFEATILNSGDIKRLAIEIAEA